MRRTYAIIIKPVSSRCNLLCSYCYYSGKKSLLNVEPAMMSHEVLDSFIRQNIGIHGRDAVIEFAWHGGEPLLAGIEFFREALRLQREYGNGRKILNTLQTNATLLNDEYCEFFRTESFLLGVSIDGPEEIHNAYRGDTFSQAMKGIDLLRKHGVPFNTLTAVNSLNSKYPREVYSFLRELTDYMQFLPVIEAMPTSYEIDDGQKFARPPGIFRSGGRGEVATFSVEPEQWGAFMCSVLGEWLKNDAGRKHVQLIDAAIGNMMGIPCPLCVHNPLCGHSGCVEANGDVYSCDRYAFPQYYLGNIMDTELAKLMEMNREFGMHKSYGLPDECLDCHYLRLCFGGCPKDRLKGGKNYLCRGYKLFFSEIVRMKTGTAPNSETTPEI